MAWNLGYGRGMQITIRHGGYGTIEEYRAEIVKGLKGYGMFEMWFTEAELGTATAIRVDFGNSLFQVDTEANVVNKVRECLRRVDSRPGL